MPASNSVPPPSNPFKPPSRKNSPEPTRIVPPGNHFSPTPLQPPSSSPFVASSSPFVEGISTDLATQIAANLAELTEAARSLNTLSDKLTGAVSEIETVINALGLGVTAFVRFEDSMLDDMGNINDAWCLRYEKTGKKWGFVISYEIENVNLPMDDTYESWPFAESPREQRMKAVKVIPELIAALVNRTKAMTDSVAKSVVFARGVAAALPHSPEKQK